MRSSKGFLAAAVAVVLVLSGVVAAGALITSSSGSVIRLSTPPTSVALNKLENATSVYAFDEQQGKTLTSAVAVDAVNPGTYTTFPSGSATVASGTVVDSHLIHSDIPSRNYTARRQGTVTFANPILGVVASTARLASSDAALGATGTTYAGTTQWRGLEGSSENGWSNVADKFVISTDRKTLTFDIKTYVMDEIRVITGHTNPLVTTITGSPEPVQVGDNVTYTVKVTNTGSSTATGVQVQDAFPGATFVSATAPSGCTGTSSPVTCSLGSITAGGFATATIVVKSPSSPTTLTNTATSPPGQAPAATATTSVVSPSLTTTIADSPDPITAGNDVQYTLTVTNNGIATIADAHVLDTMPPGATFKSSTPTGVCTGSAPVNCQLGALTVGASASVKIVVTIPGPVGTATNTATATPGTNPTATETTGVEAPVDGVSKGFVSPGGSLTIPGDDPATLSLPNTGNGAPVVITQEDGTFCGGQPCQGPATTISEFPNYDDPLFPISLVLEYNFPSSPTSLTDAATAYGSTIYKTIDPDNPNLSDVVPPCATFGAGVAIPHPCVDARSINQTSPNTFVVTFTIKYISGDPKFARR